MEPIYFLATYGDQKKKVELSRPAGYADGYFITIDNGHSGILTRIRGEWQYRGIFTDEFTSDDIQILGAMIDESEGLI